MNNNLLNRTVKMSPTRETTLSRKKIVNGKNKKYLSIL